MSQTEDLNQWHSSKHSKNAYSQDDHIQKISTGVAGFDDISGGGLPDGRLTVILGGPGSGKTIFAIHCLAHRLIALDQAGIFVSFEEALGPIYANITSFEWEIADKPRLQFIDARITSGTLLGGSFDLSGLLAGISALKDEIGARTVVFDGLGVLLSGLDDEKLEKQELNRLDEWIHEVGISVLVTSNSFGKNDRDRRRSERLQYMTDCAIHLEKIYTTTTSSRSLRILKYRGSGFAANPMPAVITHAGFEIVALTRARLDYPTFTDRISSGIRRLDGLMDGGYLRGSSVLISGSPGTSKTSLGATFAAAACAREERVLFVSFDESGAQIVANMRSIGLDLEPHVAAGRLIMASEFSSGRSPEEHFVIIRDLVRLHSPDCLVIDPLSALLKGDYAFSTMVCESILDLAKSRGVTLVCTSLLEQIDGDQELSASHVSTIADTWIHVSYVAVEGERNRALTIVKSRGTSHSKQVRELVLCRSGIDLFDVYAAEGEVLMGSARRQKEAEVLRRNIEHRISQERSSLQAERDIDELRARINAMTRELEWKQREAALAAKLDTERAALDHQLAEERIRSRLADTEVLPEAESKL